MTRLVDFLFTGVAVLPGTLLLAGRPDLAMISFCPLLIAACLTSAWFDECAASVQVRRTRSSDRPSDFADGRVPARSPRRH